MTGRICKTCGFWSQWLPSSGDCLLHAYQRRNAILNDSEAPPARPADMTAVDDTCAKWAPSAEVKEFVNGGQEPAAWKQHETTR